jgi:hypothetical protein
VEVPAIAEHHVADDEENPFVAEQRKEQQHLINALVT